ncbi:MAG: HAD-IB family hydrolase [Actinomycetes bacterium]
MRLREALSGKRILLTGVTGFLGEALLERLLSDVPDTQLVLLIRSRPSQTADDRVTELLTRPAFRALREVHGEDGVARMRAERVTVLDGSLELVPALPADLDVVVHCAGDVSFDPPIDVAMATNLLGTVRLLEAVHAAGGNAHFVYVSTAYVAGLRRGPVPESRLLLNVDWRTEVDAAERLRHDIEAASRTPDVLRKLRREAEVEHRRAGPSTVSADVEVRRRDWVQRELVDAGRERARSLGFADVYTLSKALTECAVEEAAADLPLTVVRPSIIESALRRPYPGWIEGFKMAEPIILAYGRGELPEFPAVPDGVLDVIPVDLVVGAILAVSAQERKAGAPEYFHVSSGARNALGFHRLYELVRGYFQAHPLEQPGRGAIAVPAWAFPGGDRVRTMLRLGERATDLVDRAIGVLPSNARMRERVSTLDRRRRQLQSLRKYMELYGSYTESELTFVDERTLALHNAMDPSDQDEFGCDAAVVDWRYYLQDVHCPSITAPLRAFTGVGSRRRMPAVTLTASGGEAQVLAVFDLDGTLLASNVVESYLRLRLVNLARHDQVREVADVAASLPRYLIADRRDRGAMLRAVYQRYAGASLDELNRLVDEELADEMLTRVWPAAIRRVRDHRAAGHRTVLITGAIRPVTRPLAPLFDEIAAADLAVVDGRCNGHLAHPPLVGESRASWLLDYASRTGADLSASYGYADSASDLPMLRAVGHPVAVSPDLTVTRAARRGRWPVEDWRDGRPSPLSVRELTPT